MKLLFAAGGTGGHINPAIAIAEAMKRRHKNISIAFVGRSSGEENKAVTERGFKLYTLNIKGLPRKISAEAASSLYLALRSLGESKKIIRDFSPDAIIATGGYVSWPIVKCGIKNGVPTIMHESNIFPGLVTRRLGEKCDALLLNSDESIKFLKSGKNCIKVGNPLREDFFGTTRKNARSSLGIGNGQIFVVSFGGSLGAEKINNAVLSLMENYSSKEPRIVHLHSSGTRYYEKIKSENKKFTIGVGGCKIKPYIDNMPTVLTAADIVISRAGAMTLSEIARCGTAAILIPSPNVADDHQRKNAEALSASKAALMINEDELPSGVLEEKLSLIVKNQNLRESLARNVKTFYDAEACEKICSQIEALIK